MAERPLNLPETPQEVQTLFMQECAVNYLQHNMFIIDMPLLLETPMGQYIVQPFYADEAHGGGYDQ